MKFKRLATILMAAAMMVSLVACTGDNGENSETPVASGNDVVEETETNHITLAESWGFENFYTIMTPDVSASNFGITYYLSNFYDVLVEYQDGEYVGGLAEDWTISEDGTVYTFNLRHDVKFSDGSDLTAEDVAKSLLAVPINLGQYNGTYGRLSTIIEDAVVVDDYTVEMHLTQPYYNALRELCLANPFGIVSSEQLNDDLTKKDTFETATYGTGPYMYAGDNDGQTWNFESNPYYWGERPDVESFSIKSIPDNDAKILALKNGEIDFVAGITNVSNESFVEMQNTEGFGAKVDDKSFRTGYIGYNLSSSMFGDEVVRQAITLALDKDAISESIYGGLYEKADTFFPKTLPYCDVEQTVYSYDIDRANQLLDEAGYSSRSISCPACQGRPQAESLTGHWAGSWRALWGGYGCVLPALLVCTFQGAAKGEVFPPFAVLPKKGLGEYPHAANFSKCFFMSRRIRSLRLITARWVTPIRRAYSLVERWS